MNEPRRRSTASTYRIIGLGIAVAVVVASLGIWAFFASSGDPEPRILGVIDDHRPEVGSPAPDFALTDVRDGKAVLKLSDYRGKVVILNWYASWCAPCRQEIPDFQEAYTHLSDDIVVFAVNLQEERSVAADLLKDLGATFPAVVDVEGKVSEHYRVAGMPVTYVIDRDGIIVAGGRGIMTEDALRGQLAQFELSYPES